MTVGRAARRVTASVLGARGYEIRRIPAPETGPVPDPRTVDDFARAREIDHNVPDGVALLIRYHSMDAAAVAPLMDARDREYTARYFDVFTRYDHGKKTPFHRRRCASTRTGTSSRTPSPSPTRSDAVSTVVLGAGVSGLAAGMASGAPAFEAFTGPGGLCSSYYVRVNSCEGLDLDVFGFAHSLVADTRLRSVVLPHVSWADRARASLECRAAELRARRTLRRDQPKGDRGR